MERMTKVSVYGIHGKARAGKDMFADMLGSAIEDNSENTRVLIMSFADVLKDMLVPLLRVLSPGNMPPNMFVHECLAGEMKETSLPRIGKSPRQLMQWLGTEWGRELVDQDIWVKVMDKRIENSVNDILLYNEEEIDRVIVLIPDVRFDNEAQWLHGRVIHIVRPNGADVAEHDSERGIAEHSICTKVYNDGTLDDLEKEAKRVMMEINCGRI